ncbi:MAG: hypothetical protein KKE37_10475, partial [Verrucomicrobia bacterium]|nr:hypothetical protein [Verrucomicrobiota bacterium]
MNEPRITARCVGVGLFFSAVFAALSIVVSNKQNMSLAACQIPVLPYFLLIAMILLLNPLCRLIRRLRVFSTVEMLVIFMMGAVSAGIPNFGLVEQVVPIAGSLFNQEWNNKQSEWNRYIVPFVNSDYFVAEPGLQTAARNYHDALAKSQELKKAFETARRFQDTLSRVAAAEADLKKAEDDVAQGPEARNMAVSRAQARLDAARNSGQKTEREWETLKAGGLPSLDEVLGQYPALVQEWGARAEQAETILLQQEETAFKKIETFRRGLPRGLSAYPGFFPLPEDDWYSYSGRMRRLVKGLAALRAIKQASRDLVVLPSAQPPDAVMASSLDRILDAALSDLQPLSDTAVLEQRKALFQKEDEQVTQQDQELDLQLKRWNEEKRNASRVQALKIKDRIGDLMAESMVLDKKQARLDIKLEQNDRQLVCAAAVRKLMDDLVTIKAEVWSGQATAGSLKTSLQAAIPVFVSIDVSLRRYFIGEVPWSHWLKPIGRWLILIGMTYVVLMSLNVLIFRQWAHNEKLTYPLAELPKTLLGEAREDGVIPVLFRNGLFWVGAGISGMVMGWNLLCATNIVPGLTPFILTSWWGVHLNGTAFAALGNTATHVFFTMIGLSFLTPKNISFSLWFFYLLYLVQLQLMVWTGQGQDLRSFPTNWWYLLNFRTAEGQGAMMVFSSVILYKCRKYLFCAFRPSTVADLEDSERKELRAASWAFIGCSIGVIVQLSWSMGANLLHTIFCYLVILLITVGMVRAVTEGGLLGVKSYITPFHFIRAFFGLNQKWTVVSLFTPLILYYGVMFLDIKSFIAPAMANALKLRDDYRLRRGIFHGVLALAIVAAVVVALITALMMCYAQGADSMSRWYYTSLPRLAMFGT